MMDIIVVDYEAGEEREGQSKLLVDLDLPDFRAGGAAAWLREAVQVICGVVALLKHLQEKADGLLLLLLGGGQEVT